MVRIAPAVLLLGLVLPGSAQACGGGVFFPFWMPFLAIAVLLARKATEFVALEIPGWKWVPRVWPATKAWFLSCVFLPYALAFLSSGVLGLASLALSIPPEMQLSLFEFALVGSLVLTMLYALLLTVVWLLALAWMGIFVLAWAGLEIGRALLQTQGLQGAA